MLFETELFASPLFAEGQLAGLPRVRFTLDIGAPASPAYTAPIKDPSDIEDYGLDCSVWLGNETIAERTVVSDNPALEISGLNVVDGVVRWRASGGIDGKRHAMTVRVTSTTGRAAERTVALPVRDL